MRVLFPSYARFGFAPHMAQLWEWVWAIRRGVRPPPMVAVWFRGAAKSTTAEAALAALGARGVRRYALYVCHEKGTLVRDPDDGWMAVEEHPTAAERHEEGLRVKVAGLPFTETVTAEHRYWARRVARKDRGHGRAAQVMMTSPTWCEAQHLDWNTWLGLPVDMTTEDRSPDLTKWDSTAQMFVPSSMEAFDDPDMWWVIGNWWGDGTLGGARGAQISWSTADAHPEVRAKLVDVLSRHGYEPRLRPKASACADVTICDSTLSRWLATWRQGRNRKCPPEWVERLPLDKQAALLRGYFEADGSVTDRGAALVSIHLPGLLSVRRILARLGVPAAIDGGGPPRPSTIEGRTYATQRRYRLSVRQGAEVLGFDPLPYRDRVVDVFIDEGHLWSRVRKIEPSGPAVFVPITTSTGTYETSFALSHNCNTQDQADEHVGTLGEMLASPRFAALYPEMASRAVTQYGSSRGWSRKRLHTASGFVVDALGLEKNVRGLRVDEDRPDIIVLDDVDADTDGPAAVKKKIDLITRKILPTGAADLAVLAVQNLVHPDSIFARLAGRAEERADFLIDRIVVGPVPAIEGLEVDVEPETGRHVVVGGTPTWVGYDLARAQDAIDTFGYSSFLAEGQHVVKAASGGMFDRVRFVRCDPPEVPPLSMRTCWVDPAVEGGEQNDSQAIQIDGLSPSGVIYRLWSWEGKIGPQEAIEIALRHAIRFGCSTLGIETDQGGKTWKSVYNEACRTIRDRYCGTCWARFGQPEDDEVVARALRDQHCRDENHAVFGGPFPGYRSEKAGSGLGPKAHRASQMLADYEIGGRIVHVRGTHVVLEAALTRFPKVKPFDLTDASFYSWRACSIRRSGMSTGRSGRVAARTQMPSVLG